MNNNLKLPSSPNFSSGPVKKVAGWDLTKMDLSLLGRSHRGKDFTALSQEVVFKTKNLLEIPEDYKLILVTGGATGAMECALWNMIGERAVDCLAWEVFGDLWYKDLTKELKLKEVNLHSAEFGEYPDLSKVDFKNNDVVFTYSGSTSGIIFKDEDKIPDDRNGLIFADATTYSFSYKINWQKVDVVAISWQKAIAGEAAHGIVVMSPNAIKRLKAYTPEWGIPSVINIKNKVALDNLLDTGFSLNTPSILCYLDAKYNLDYIIAKGGMQYVKQQIAANYNALNTWVNNTEWIEYLAKDESYRSRVIVCLKFTGDFWNILNYEQQKLLVDSFVEYLSFNNVAYDIAMHKKSKTLGVRIWIGYSILTEDIELLTKWLEAAYIEVKGKITS